MTSIAFVALNDAAGIWEYHPAFLQLVEIPHKAGLYFHEGLLVLPEHDNIRRWAPPAHVVLHSICRDFRCVAPRCLARQLI